ncbi:hypothetical protein DY000_02053108 [Brassica cretica]|uniref:Uncharacterized protein n=1 Tax=Brassica cretica TaxID=69181 RepID=A0ABQ7AH36_BRACR|nr:hypothetical protein DY000_02053108 [Brassica cretica]
MDDQKKMSCALWNNRDVGGSDHMSWLRILLVYYISSVNMWLYILYIWDVPINKSRENSKMVVLPVTFKGANFLLCARLAKNALGGRELWEVVEEGRNPKKTTLGEDGEPSTSRTIRSGNEGGEGKALASTSSTAMRNNQDEAIRRSDIEALIKILKDNSCNTLDSYKGISIDGELFISIDSEATRELMTN